MRTLKDSKHALSMACIRFVVHELLEFPWLCQCKDVNVPDTDTTVSKNFIESSLLSISESPALCDSFLRTLSTDERLHDIQMNEQIQSNLLEINFCPLICSLIDQCHLSALGDFFEHVLCDNELKHELSPEYKNKLGILFIYCHMSGIESLYGRISSSPCIRKR